MAAASTGASLSIVTSPDERSTSTAVTPEMLPTSSLTDAAQCPQVIPVTVTVTALMPLPSLLSVFACIFHSYYTPLGYSTLVSCIFGHIPARVYTRFPEDVDMSSLAPQV